MSTSDQEAPESDGDGGFDLDERELCPDGDCLGVIGEDGRCRVCGSEGTGPSGEADARRTGGDEDRDGDTESGANDDDRDETDGDSADDNDDDDDDDGGATDDRELCPDGSCVGLIGDDGRCKVCGRARGDEPA